MSKNATGSRDLVVLQEQSHRHSLQDLVVKQDVYSYAAILDSLINVQDPCAENIFFMTWVRKNWDTYFCSSWPPGMHL